MANAAYKKVDLTQRLIVTFVTISLGQCMKVEIQAARTIYNSSIIRKEQVLNRFH